MGTGGGNLRRNERESLDGGERRLPSRLRCADRVGGRSSSVAGLARWLRFSIFAGILLVASVPVLIIAWQGGLSETIRRFLIAAGVIGSVLAMISASSERLVNQCKAAGNPSCIDYGATGFQLLVVIGFVLTAAVKAFILYRD